MLLTSKNSRIKGFYVYLGELGWCDSTISILQAWIFLKGFLYYFWCCMESEDGKPSWLSMLVAAYQVNLGHENSSLDNRENQT